MNRRQLLLLPFWVLAALLLAYPLREAVVQGIILPILYLLWMLRLLYRALPQPLLWILLITGVLFWALTFVLKNLPPAETRTQPAAPTVGPVRALAGMLQHESRGVYFKWQVARMLAEIALDLQELRTHTASRTLRLDDTRLAPQGRQYLIAGLGTSFADYPMPGPFQPTHQTPFDADLDPVLTYLEHQMEMSDDRRNS